MAVHLVKTDPGNDLLIAIDDRTKHNLINIENNPNLLKQYNNILSSIGEIYDNMYFDIIKCYLG